MVVRISLQGFLVHATPGQRRSTTPRTVLPDLGWDIIYDPFLEHIHMNHATSYLGQLTCFGCTIPVAQTFSHPLLAAQHTGIGDQSWGSLYIPRPSTDYLSTNHESSLLLIYNILPLCYHNSSVGKNWGNLWQIWGTVGETFWQHCPRSGVPCKHLPWFKFNKVFDVRIFSQFLMTCFKDCSKLILLDF